MGAFFIHPLDGNQYVRQSRRGPDGVAVGEEDHVFADLLERIKYCNAVGNTGWMVRHDDRPALARDVLHALA